MSAIDAAEFRQQGTAHFVLASAGLVKVIPRTGHDELRATDRLTAMFPAGMPPLEEVIPPLLEVVQARQGVASADSRGALGRLNGLGMSIAAQRDLDAALDEGFATAKMRIDETIRMQY